MPKQKPSEMTDDELLKAHEDAGFIETDEVVTPPTEEPTPPEPVPEAPKEPEKAPETPTEDPSTPPENPVEPPATVKEPEGEADPQSVPRDRPKKYIPLSQYQSEKAETKATIDELNKKITDLQNLKDLSNKPDTGANTDKLKEFKEKFAEKYGYDPEDVDELLSIARSSVAVPDEVVNFMKEQQNTQLQKQIADNFNKEFNAFTPSLKDMFPNATPEQIDNAKKLIDQASHTEAYRDKELDYVAFKIKGDLEKVFVTATPPSTETPPPQKGTRVADSGRMGNSNPTAISADSFKGKTSFDELNTMDPEVRSKLINDFDAKTYHNFVQWSGQGQGLEVNRGGRKIRLD